MLFLILYVIFEFSGVITLENVREAVLYFGTMAGGVIILLLASDIVTPVPSSVLMVLAGSLYGFIPGALIGFAGSVSASVAGFVLARTQKSKILQVIKKGDDKAMNRWFVRWGEGILILSRPVPMVAEAMSVFAGSTDISFKRFFSLISVGTAPMVIFYSYSGSIFQNVHEWSLPLVLGVGIPGALWLLLHLKMKRGHVNNPGKSTN